MNKKNKKYPVIELPYGPSVNQLYVKRLGYGKYIWTNKARQWKKDVSILLRSKRPKEPLGNDIVFSMWVYPPDKRKRDSSNLIKPVEDSIVDAGWITDDRYVIKHFIHKCEPVPGGKVKVMISPTSCLCPHCNGTGIIPPCKPIL